MDIKRITLMLLTYHDSHFRTVIEYCAKALDGEMNVEKAANLASAVADDYESTVKETMQHFGWQSPLHRSRHPPRVEPAPVQGN